MKIKKIFNLILVALFIVVLTSCDKLNYSTPYGSITDSTFASAANVSVTNKELYNRLRVDNYSKITTKMEEFLIKDFIAKATYEDNHEEYDKLILSDILQTYSVETYKTYPQNEIIKLKQQYIDKMFKAYGIEIPMSAVESYDANVEQDNILGNFPEIITNLYRTQIAKNLFAKDLLTEEVLLEKIDDEKNPVYISEENIEDRFDIIRDYGIKRAIIIRYSSYKEAFDDYETITSTLGAITEDSTFEEVVNFYIALYNQRYSFFFADTEGLTIDNYYSREEVEFIYNKDKNELGLLNSTIEHIFDEFEDGEFTMSPKNIDGHYTMILKIDHDVRYGEEIEKFEDLPLAEQQTVKEEIIEQLIEEKINSTYIQRKIKEMLDDSDIQIYDPLYDYYYAEGNDDYNRTTNFNNELVFKITYDGKTYELKVDDFYAEILEINGLEETLDILTAKFIANNPNYNHKIDKDAMKSIESEYKDATKNFKKMPEKTMGFDNFLLTKFGYNNKNDVIDYYYKVLSLRNDVVRDLGKLKDDENNFLQTGTIFDTFEKYTTELYANYFSLQIEHILISIDYDNDGNMDDPRLFREKLSQTARDEFDRNIASLARAIVLEANTISASTFNALKSIQTAYLAGDKVGALGFDENGDRLPDEEVPTWNDFKWNYNISLTVESLGTLDNTTALNYVSGFSIRAKELYDYLTDEERADYAEFDDDEGYLEHIDKAKNETLVLDDLTYTNYGYHILNVTDLTTNNSALSTESSDYKLHPDDPYKRYQHIKVIIDEKDLETEDDDIYAFADAYSDFDHPSTQQLFIYYFEKLSTSSDTSFRTTTKQAISAVFDGFLSRFNNAIFQQFRLELRLGEINFTNSTFEHRREVLNAIRERELDNYADTSSLFYNYHGWFDANWIITEE